MTEEQLNIEVEVLLAEKTELMRRVQAVDDMIFRTKCRYWGIDIGKVVNSEKYGDMKIAKIVFFDGKPTIFGHTRRKDGEWSGNVRKAYDRWSHLS